MNDSADYFECIADQWDCLACGASTASGIPGLYCEGCRQRIEQDVKDRADAWREARNARRRARTQG